tara:strand:- start:3304 stop:3825 length:522 start_codon:yes stop_codon:yes gene_type:complete
MPNIQQFKQALADGGARPNQFELDIPFPGQIGKTGANEILLVSGAALPASTVNPVITQYRGREVKFAGERIFDPWTITVINDNKQSLRQKFEKWMDLINERETNEGVITWSEYQTDITVNHLDRNNNPLDGGKYILEQAFPINMSEIALQYAQNDIIEEFTVTFQYQTYNITN